MNIKKIAALFLTTLFLLAAFVGCADQNGTTSSADPDSSSQTPSEGEDGSTGASNDSSDALDQSVEPDVSDDSDDSDASVTPDDSQDISAGSDTSSASDDTVSENAPHVHSYGEWTVTKKPTCTETGSRTRSCECGDVITEVITENGHDFADDGVCRVCGKNQFDGNLRVLDDLVVDSLLYCSQDLIVFEKDGSYYIADRNGKVLSGPYKSINCANPDSYVVAYTETSKIISTYEDDGDTYNTTRYDRKYYVINKNGKSVFEKEYVVTSTDLSSNEFEGEYIDSCNEDRIVTIAPYKYYFPSDHSNGTVRIYDMQGKKLAEYENVRDCGTYINGELILLTEESNNINIIKVIDKNGKELRRYNQDFSYDFMWFDSWTSAGFVNGYAMIINSYYRSHMYTDTAVLFSKDFSKLYKIKIECLGYGFSGTLVPSKIYVDGKLSDEYYLIDLAKCKTDDEGYCIPTADAAVSSTGYGYMSINNVFGEVESYALVSKGDKWGYLALDGTKDKFYDDAGAFSDGIAIVKDGSGVYVIDRNFNRISNILTGYSGVTSYNGGAFIVKTSAGRYVAVY